MRIGRRTIPVARRSCVNFGLTPVQFSSDPTRSIVDLVLSDVCQGSLPVDVSHNQRS